MSDSLLLFSFQMSLCSAEDDTGPLDVEDDLHSPTDVSEDSVEVRVTPIAGPAKRKLVQKQPQTDLGGLGLGAGSPGESKCPKRTALPPSPKRRRPASPLSPFRPWSVPSSGNSSVHGSVPPSTPVPSLAPTPDRALISIPAPQEEPLALVKTRVTTASTTVPVIPRNPRSPRSPRTIKASSASRFSVESIIGEVVAASTSSRQPLSKDVAVEGVDRGGGGGSSAHGSTHGSASSSRAGASAGGQQRNYKNMTRERRIEANARERTRVHTISAAFDTLRRSVPAYSHSQKLSKLSVLRIACSYILTLSRVAGMDYSADQSRPPVQECVDLVTKTIQTEGKLRRKRDD